MAEFLVRAQASTNKAASEVGDIIIVRPDGHEWGKAECLPEYIVIKLPDVKIEDVKKFEESLREQDGVSKDGHPIFKTVARRKYKLPAATIQAAATLAKSVVTFEKTSEKTALIESVTAKIVDRER
jgi:predicted ABC-type ATPase